MSLDPVRAPVHGRLLLISLAIMLLSLALPIALLQIYDRILPNQGVGTAWVLGLGVLTAILLEAGLRYGRSWLLARETMRLDAAGQVQAVKALLHGPASEIRALGRPRIENGFAALRQINEYASGQALLALYEAPFILLFLGMVAYVGGWVAAIPAALLIVAFCTVYWMGNRANAYHLRVEDANQDRQTLMQSLFGNVLSVKSMALEGSAIRNFDQRQQRLSEERAGLDEYLMRIQLVTSFFSQATTVLVVMLSAHLVIEGDMSSGALAACTLLAGRTMAPVGALFSSWGRFQGSGELRRQAADLLALGDKAQPEQESASGAPVGLDIRDLQFDGETGRYRLHVEAGQVRRLEEPGWRRWSHLFQGLTEGGAGQGFQLESDAGSPQTWRVVWVQDQCHLFHGTVLENLTLFSTERETLALQWARRLGLYERISLLPQGYQTRLAGAGNQGLDHGTLQLVGLVRALASEPQLLLLEHADSGLDIAAQKSLAVALSELQQHITCLVVTNSALLKESLQVADVFLEGEA